MKSPALAFHLLAKPTGATCNLDCKYCFFLSKDSLYPNERTRMSDDVQELYIRQRLAQRNEPEINIAWQGGEPLRTRKRCGPSRMIQKSGIVSDVTNSSSALPRPAAMMTRASASEETSGTVKPRCGVGSLCFRRGPAGSRLASPQGIGLLRNRVIDPGDDNTGNEAVNHGPRGANDRPDD